jgi:hypothetical protein
MILAPRLPGFADELEKIARVPQAVKQYRRSAQGFEEASRSALADKPHFRATDGFAIHGTDDLNGIIDSGHIRPSPMGPKGQHGGGVYWWNGFPREGYAHGLMDEGIHTNYKTLENKMPLLKNIVDGHDNIHGTRTPGNYNLRPKDTAIVDMATRANNKTLSPLLADAAERRLRTVDTGLFHRARQRITAINPTRGTTQIPRIPRPGKLELMKQFSNRLAGHLT